MDPPSHPSGSCCLNCVFVGLQDKSIITLSLSLSVPLLLLVEYEIEQKIQSGPRLSLVTEKTLTKLLIFQLCRPCQSYNYNYEASNVKCWLELIVSCKKQRPTSSLLSVNLAEERTNNRSIQSEERLWKRNQQKKKVGQVIIFIFNFIGIKLKSIVEKFNKKGRRRSEYEDSQKSRQSIYHRMTREGLQLRDPLKSSSLNTSFSFQ